MPIRVAYFTNIAPHYRTRLWSKLLDDPDISYHFFFGKPGSSGIRAMDMSAESSEKTSRLHAISNIRFKSVVVYQRGVLSQIWTGKWEVAMFLGDMYIVSTWLAVWLAKLKGIPVYFWGHGIYGNEGRLKSVLRKWFLSMANGHFLYGNHARQLMIRQGFDPLALHVVFNSLDYDKHLELRAQVIDNSFYQTRAYFHNNVLPTLIFIGRLTKEKKMHTLLEAMVKMNDQGFLVNLIVVGDGPEKSRLEADARKLKGQVYFYGPCYDELEIGRLVANADLCVSPGNVGLTAIHCLSFGTPVCTHDDLTEQMPEAEAIQSMVTGIYFDKKSQNMNQAITTWLSTVKDREVIRAACFSTIDKFYNPYFQSDLFRSVLMNNRR